MQQDTDIIADTAQDNQPVLRVLSGAQKGAEMALRAATYTLGSADDADIVLSDSSLAAHHVSIAVTDDGVFLEALEDIIVTAEGRFSAGATGERIKIKKEAAILIGGLHIGFGRKDTEWDGLILPTIPEDEDDLTEEEHEEEDEDEATAGMDAEEDVSKDETQETDDIKAEKTETVSGQDADPAVKQSPVVEKRRNRTSWLVASILTVLIAATLSGIYYRASYTDTIAKPAVAVETVDARANAQKVLDQLGASSVVLNLDTHGRVVASGVVETAGERAHIRSEFTAAGLSVVDKMRAADVLINAVETTLSHVDWPSDDFKDHLVVTHLGGGQIEISGYLGPEVDVSSLKRQISIDVPGVSDVHFSKNTLLFWQDFLQQRIDTAGLSDWLSVRPQAGDLHVDGELSAGQLDQWLAVGEDFVATSGGWPRIDIGVSVLPEVGATESPTLDEPPAPVDVPEMPAFVADAFDTLSELDLPTFSALPEIAALGSPDHGVAHAEHIGKASQRGQVAKSESSSVESERQTIEVVGVIASSSSGNIALIGGGGSVRVGDTLSDGSVVVQVSMKGVSASDGHQTIFYKLKDLS